MILPQFRVRAGIVDVNRCDEYGMAFARLKDRWKRVHLSIDLSAAVRARGRSALLARYQAR